MNKQYYELLGLDESATDESVTARYEELKKKYSEDRFLEGEAGNEAARMLNRIDVAYHEIMSERGERRTREDAGSAYAKVDELIRAGNLSEAQAALDEFNERPAEWHYLQSVIFYKKNWMNESKKQLEIAIQMDGENTKYRTAYNKLKEKIEFDKNRRIPPRPRRRRAPRERADTTKRSNRWAAASASSAPPAARATCCSTAV